MTSWLFPIMGITQQQRDACFNLYVKQKEAGKVQTRYWMPKNQGSREKAGVKYKKPPKPIKPRTNISFSKGNAAEDKLIRALKMRSENKMSSSQIAEVLNVHPATVRKWFQKHPKK